MKTTLTLAASSVLLLLSCNGQKKEQEANEAAYPNIVYILADDLGYGDIQAYHAESKIQTPALDSLANEGIMFTDAHSGSAVSTPTRYGILTGRYAFRSRLKSGVLVGHSPSLIEPGRETAASLLRKSGYATACIGKWHLGLDWARIDTTKPLFTGNEWDIKDTQNVDYTAQVHGGPSDHGFDYSYIIPASLDIAPYVYIENGWVNSPVRTHVPDWHDDRAHGMWYRHGDKADNFVYFPLTAPHTPWLPSEAFEGKSEAGVYGDFVCMVDDVVRQIRQALAASGQLENTILIFTSDNGSSWTAQDIEETGHRANAETKAELFEGEDGSWYQGDQILAAIGQSEHRFTPMQLCVYASTLATQGDRYRATFLNRIVSSDNRSLLKESQVELMSHLDISDEAYMSYMQGMCMVTQESGGTAYSVFRDYPIQVAGKTGTAETDKTDKSDNGSFICFAPAYDPEIAISVYGEQAGHGSSMAGVAKDILDSYFEVGAPADVNSYENKLS